MISLPPIMPLHLISTKMCLAAFNLSRTYISIPAITKYTPNKIYMISLHPPTPPHVFFSLRLD